MPPGKDGNVSIPVYPVYPMGPGACSNPRFAAPHHHGPSKPAHAHTSELARPLMGLTGISISVPTAQPSLGKGTPNEHLKVT